MIWSVIDIDESDKLNNEILEKHITKYVNAVAKVLAVTYLVITISEILVSIFMKAEHFLPLLINHRGESISLKKYLTIQFIYQCSIWIIFLIYFLMWNRSSFSVRKSSICALALILTTIFCFYHWKNNNLSILYIIPVVITIPLDKKRNKTVILISILMMLIYSVYQFSINRKDENFLIAISSIVTVIALQFICIKIHNSMNRAFLDIKTYAQKEEILYDKIAHDELTEAFSKTALEADINDLSSFRSLSFIDVDNFKHINDEQGHQMGDNILKLLVFCLKTKGKNVYRYGGDEFLILSPMPKEELAEDIKRLKTKFTYYAADLFDVKATVSVGIININHEETGAQNINRCDELMYKSKEKGKNTLTIG